MAGFVIALPVGAIGAMCLRRALQGRWLIGLVTGLGAAIADAVLAAGAMFGLSLVTQYLLDHQAPLRLVGGLFLIYLGIYMIRSHKPVLSVRAKPASLQWRHWRVLPGSFSTGFALTIINPATFIAFMGVFAGLGLFAEELESLAAEWLIIAGAFIGSVLWWVTLTTIASAVRHHVPLAALTWINTALGIVVVGFGVASIASLASLVL